MNIRYFDTIDNFPKAVALGCFDGLHIGHRRVIEQLSGDLPVCVLTFAPISEKESIGKGQPLLSSVSLREKILSDMGVDTLLYMHFDEQLRKMPPERFVSDILGKIGTKIVSCGYNYHFGYGGKADASDLQVLCKPYGIEVRVAEQVQYAGLPVSSTEIRSLVEKGDMPLVYAMLGRYFTIDFTVVSGNRLGRTLGAPTINQPFPAYHVIPRFGVYASISEIDGKKHPSVTNVGVKPSAGGSPPQAETYIPDFSGDLYGRAVPVEFVEFIRPEVKFDTIDILKDQIHTDAEKALAILRQKTF